MTPPPAAVTSSMPPFGPSTACDEADIEDGGDISYGRCRNGSGNVVFSQVLDQPSIPGTNFRRSRGNTFQADEVKSTIQSLYLAFHARTMGNIRYAPAFDMFHDSQVIRHRLKEMVKDHPGYGRRNATLTDEERRAARTTALQALATRFEAQDPEVQRIARAKLLRKFKPNKAIRKTRREGRMKTDAAKRIAALRKLREDVCVHPEFNELEEERNTWLKCFDAVIEAIQVDPKGLRMLSLMMRPPTRYQDYDLADDLTMDKFLD
ncbi:hypothetical protein BCR44DRAFT_48056 [Catenaria anguillulae PL171]|uniref:Uncharacterized protein n=1 Tax=Catenaria anguillulae PL171 TaxID=765915 RepID=A0A1Y2I1Z5_9FUNG|nr:hypothetical protein BCR44DRAFT_48056 [Catenaria anguillulae PL171]